MRLLVRGRLEAKGYKRDNGTTVGELVVHVIELEFLSPKKAGGAGDEPADAGNDLPLAISEPEHSRRRKN